MGFCRRCGDIVSGERCKCGGTAVAPVVSWDQSNPKQRMQDRWLKTYASKNASSTSSPVEPVPIQRSGSTRSLSPTKRFPRPLSTYSGTATTNGLGNRVSAHITSTTSHFNRPPSPVKLVAAPEADILPSLTPHDTTLSKVYGSVLQSSESLSTHACSICSNLFPPDATIYPDPSAYAGAVARFLCKTCFTSNGGSKGLCPTCARPVLITKSDGGYVEAAGQAWHKKCFICDGCETYIGDKPMLDLLGLPSCTECFDSCLTRDRKTKKPRTSLPASPGSPMAKRSKSREGSPALEELEQRLGIVKSRESTPEIEELSRRLDFLGRSPSGAQPASPLRSGGHPTSPLRSVQSTSSLRSAQSTSPLRSGSISPVRGAPRDDNPFIDRSPKPATVTGRTRFPRPLNTSAVPSRQYTLGESKTTSPTRFPLPKSTSPYTSPSPRASPFFPSTGSLPMSPPQSPPCPPTPDLMSDYADSTTQSTSSGPDSPPRVDGEEASIYHRDYGSRPTKYRYEADDVINEETASQLGTPSTPKKTGISSPSVTPSKAPRNSLPVVDATTACFQCKTRLFTVRSSGAGSFVTVPDASGTLRTYHPNCFQCILCRKPFRNGEKGQAAFVKTDKGPCHLECAPVKTTIKTTTSPMPVITRASTKPTSPITISTTRTKAASSSRYAMPPLTAPPTTQPISFPRFGGPTTCPGCRKGVALMEQGVIPGPQGTRWHTTCLVCGGKKAPKPLIRVRDDKEKGEPGCGKRLDSAAKLDTAGGIWCRECSLSLPLDFRSSPQASPTRQTMQNPIAPQATGTTTIARQFTGVGAGDGSLLRQMTGGGLSPTRSLSPTKQLGLSRPRPKSVIGMRNTKSVDEGRGMFLVRQMTGTTVTDDNL